MELSTRHMGAVLSNRTGEGSIGNTELFLQKQKSQSKSTYAASRPLSRTIVGRAVSASTCQQN